MEFLPLFHSLDGRQVLVVGGGDIALRKARLLNEAGACLKVVAPHVHPSLRELIEKSGGRLEERKYTAGDCAGCVLIVAATDIESVNIQVSQEAKMLGLPVNVVDSPALCTVIFPAIIDRSPLIIAVSSGGDAPVLARLVRAKLESWIPAAYGQLAGLAKKFRSQVKRRFDDVQARRVFWEEVFQGEIGEKVLSGQALQAEHLLTKKLEGEVSAVRGEVYLVGAGPGDPDLLTFRALRLMQQADVVLYDRLVAPAILDMCRRDADRIYVGKKRSEHVVPQDQINQLLVDLARQGKRVLRLKGGDPFIFGRGGEEIEELAAQGIAFQVVPGITAASGCAAYAGIPLTHRDYAQSVRFITGHLKDDTCDLPWQDLTALGQTLVFYMGLVGLPIICEQLIRHGRAADTPAALIQQGTTAQQRVFTGTLKTLPQLVALHEVHAPTLIVVGEVVTLREKLAWFEGGQPAFNLDR
ncbi:uroporphyrin-III C-methyltransferase/precorrin-2 dehydrogenase/sirohydrochlorin ferrochelatase [Pseudomonas duriflava]|uniref:Siroheme synthase n=1 Tax=Pseudomonas duriflava TaxID=459528 RepID=A0A562Q1B4_9PSED|nr:siroheme synthase CysG [Pseudomonas duriflava]TWI50462.1 uroporphyrin-III C-methyltransferase/precorrin-2 dehydrogenase/sirohydrochlorin ferrochelatase [Pseudomonas duriflava]